MLHVCVTRFSDCLVYSTFLCAEGAQVERFVFKTVSTRFPLQAPRSASDTIILLGRAFTLPPKTFRLRGNDKLALDRLIIFVGLRFICSEIILPQDLVPVPMYFVKVAFKLPDWMEPLSWIYPLVRGPKGTQMLVLVHLFREFGEK